MLCSVRVLPNISFTPRARENVLDFFYRNSSVCQTETGQSRLNATDFNFCFFVPPNGKTVPPRKTHRSSLGGFVDVHENAFFFRSGWSEVHKCLQWRTQKVAGVNVWFIGTDVFSQRFLHHSFSNLFSWECSGFFYACLWVFTLKREHVWDAFVNLRALGRTKKTRLGTVAWSRKATNTKFLSM